MTRQRRRLAAAVPALAGAALACAAALASPAGAATLQGRIRYEGPVPARPVSSMSSDPACEKLAPSGRPLDNLIVSSDGFLANVIVHVKAGLPEDYVAPAPSRTAIVDQRACAFEPHVLAVQVGQEIEIRNGDPTIHNVDARAAKNIRFNDPMPGQGQVIRKAFQVPELAVKLKCDIHPWMSAWIGVFDHPFFAVTDATGAYRIDGLPEGEYTVEAWHEGLGQRTAAVELDDEDETRDVPFSFVGE